MVFLTAICLSDNGNTTYYEYLYGEKPSKVEEAIITIEEDIKVHILHYCIYVFIKNFKNLQTLYTK